MTITTTTFHQQLQNKILLVCNTTIGLLLIPLIITSFTEGRISIGIVASGSVLVLILSLFLQILGYFVLSSYITIITLCLVAFVALLARSNITSNLVYLFTTYQVIPIVLSGLLSQHRAFTIGLTTVILLFLSYFVIAVQGPAIGYPNILQILGSYVCLIIISLLSDQIYLLSGKIMTRFNEEQELSLYKDKQFFEILKAYQSNQYSGEQLEKLSIDNDTLAGQANELFQKFTENIHTLSQQLTDMTLKNDSIFKSSNNILKVFSTHKDNITNYKNNIEHITGISQEMNYIIQDRKSQVNELVDLSAKGNLDITESISTIMKVSDNTKNMVEMISLIMEVAEKTNILALNAAVEASRAGKYGNGFAIVAKEIKTLSTETTQNADIINRSLQNNIAATSHAVATINNVKQSFQHLNTSIIDFSLAIDDIISKINNLTQQTSLMSIETKNTLSLISEVQNIISKTINTISQEQQTVSDIQNISSIIDQDMNKIHNTTTAISNSGRKIQEKYSEFCYSVKTIETVINEIDRTKS